MPPRSRSYSFSIVLRHVASCSRVFSNRCSTSGAQFRILVTLSFVARILDLLSAIVLIRISFSLSVSFTCFSNSSVASLILCASSDLRCEVTSPGGRLQSDDDSQIRDHIEQSRNDFLNEFITDHACSLADVVLSSVNLAILVKVSCKLPSSNISSRSLFILLYSSFIMALCSFRAVLGFDLRIVSISRNSFSLERKA